MTKYLIYYYFIIKLLLFEQLSECFHELMIIKYHIMTLMYLLF